MLIDRHWLVRLVCIGVAAATVLLPAAAEAARARSFGSDPVIIWDGGNDVVVSNGDGVTGTLADLHLTRLGDLAVLAQSEFLGITPRFNRVALLLRATSLDTVCGATGARPAFCSLKKTFGEAMGDRFALRDFRYPNQPGSPDEDVLASLSVLTVEFVAGEREGLFRPSAAALLALAEIQTVFGASNVHVGILSESSTGETGDTTFLDDINLPPPGATIVAQSAGPFAPNITCLAADPSDGAHILACAEPPAPAPSGTQVLVENAVMESNDGGYTWALKPALTRDPLWGVAFHSIAFDPRDPSVVYVAGENQLFRSANGGHTWDIVYQDFSTMLRSVVVDPNTSAVFLRNDFSLLRSTTGGEPWSAVGELGLPRISVAPGTSQSILYASGSAGIFRSSNGGTTWAALPLPPGTGPATVEAVHPSQPGTLYASREGIIYRTIDNGGSWQATSLEAPMVLDVRTASQAFYVHGSTIRKTAADGTGSREALDAAAPVTMLHVDRNNVIVAAGGRTFVSFDEGESWTTMRERFGPAPVSDLELGPNGMLIASSIAGPMTRSTDQGGSWRPLHGPHAARQIATSPDDRARALAVAGDGTLWRSRDAGETWTTVPVPPPTSGSPFVQWAVFDAATAARLYASVDGHLLTSSDDGAHWQYLNQNFQILREPVFTETAGAFYAIGFNLTTFGLFKTSDGGNTWSRLPLNLTNPATGTHVLYERQGAGATLLVAEGPMMHRSINGGQTWTSKQELFESAFTTLAWGSAPGTPSSGRVLAGTDRGVLSSANSGTTWTYEVRLKPADFPTSAVRAVRADPAEPTGRIFIGTDAGVWAHRVGNGPVNSASISAQVAYLLLNVTGADGSEVSFDVPWINGTPVDDFVWGDDTTLLVRVEANLDAARTGTFHVGTRIFTIAQAGPDCTVTLAQAGTTLPASGGSGTFRVNVQPGCDWTASTETSFITLPGNSSGAGPSTVSFVVTENTNPSSRVGSVLVGGQTFTITQSGYTATGMTPSRTALRFSAVVSGASFASRTSAETIRLLQTGSGRSQWAATSNRPWIFVEPAAAVGTTNVRIGVQYAVGVPASGTVAGTVTVRDTTTQAALATIAVTLTTMSRGTSAAPRGFIDTPLDNVTGLSGSMAVTGWAIDDVGISGVNVYREAVAGEGGTPLKFIGQAVLVEGARPDLESAFTTMPGANRAGWGYLMLTNMLPGRGTGTYRLHVFAEDTEGHTTSLGTRTITCNNAGATRPFGAIDTPGQGETVSGVVNNFGWVLSPGGARAHPPYGAVDVFIDGQVVGQPVGWTHRSDLTALFPENAFSGVNNALGVYTFDTTRLSNGVHTLAWGVTDSNGGTAGIGSRYFTVSNGAGLTLSAESGLRVNSAAARRHSIIGRRGFSLDAPFRTYRSDATGAITVQAEELDRIELQVGSVSGAYLQSPDGRRLPLPIGTNFDAEAGVFTWQPGVGFVGTYDFIFETLTEGALRIRIVLNPKGSNRVGPQVVIDAPTGPGQGFISDGPILVAGWAADLDADINTGVDTVHVWAYPVIDHGTRYADPIFIGAAAYGGERPDVAAVFGGRFRNSGYGIVTNGLGPGTYDIAVFAYSTVSGGFVPAKTVRVRVR